MSELLILDWSRDHLSAIVATEGSRGTVQSAHTIDSTDHADPLIPVQQGAELVRAWLSREGISATKTIVVVPRDAVVIRRLQVPQAPMDELPDLVRFQAATRTSASIESQALDFLLLPVTDPDHGQDVVSCTIDRDALQRIVKTCDIAHLELQRVTISPLAVGELVRSTEAADLGKEKPDLIVYQRGQQIELSIFDLGTLVFSHSTMLPEAAEDQDVADQLKPLKSDLARCLVTLQQTRPNVSPGRCFYVSGTPHAQVLSLLKKQLDSSIVEVDGRKLNPSRNTSGYEALIGASLKPHDDRLSLDLVHPRKKKEVPDRRKLYFGLGIAAAMLILSLGYGFYYLKKSDLENTIASLRKDVDQKEELLKKGKPVSDAHLRLSRWAESDSNPIDLWNQLRAQLTGTERLYFVEFKVSPLAGEMQARFIGRGNAKTRSDVDALNQGLSDHGFRVRPTTTTQGNRDPDYPWAFELDVELPRAPLPEANPKESVAESTASAKSSPSSQLQ